MKFWKDMTEGERRNASPMCWNIDDFWDNDDIFEHVNADSNGCEWSYIPWPADEQIKQAGGNE
jgi:hypothetical protein